MRKFDPRARHALPRPTPPGGSRQAITRCARQARRASCGCPVHVELLALAVREGAHRAQRRSWAAGPPQRRSRRGSARRPSRSRISQYLRQQRTLSLRCPRGRATAREPAGRHPRSRGAARGRTHDRPARAPAGRPASRTCRDQERRVITTALGLGGVTPQTWKPSVSRWGDASACARSRRPRSNAWRATRRAWRRSVGPSLRGAHGQEESCHRRHHREAVADAVEARAGRGLPHRQEGRIRAAACSSFVAADQPARVCQHLEREIAQGSRERRAHHGPAPEAASPPPCSPPSPWSGGRRSAASDRMWKNSSASSAGRWCTVKIPRAEGREVAISGPTMEALTQRVEQLERDNQRCAATQGWPSAFSCSGAQASSVRRPSSPRAAKAIDAGALQPARSERGHLRGSLGVTSDSTARLHPLQPAGAHQAGAPARLPDGTASNLPREARRRHRGQSSRSVSRRRARS